MANLKTRIAAALAVECLEARELLAVAVPPPTLAQESFDTTHHGALPTSWDQWSSKGAFAATPAADGGVEMTSTAATGQAARAWFNTAGPADVQASAGVFLDSLVPAQVLVRGSNLNTATPTFYAASVIRGGQVELTRTVNGV